MKRTLISTTTQALNTRQRKTALIFPGQGSQHVGMAADIYSRFQCAKDIIDECDHVLGGGLKDIMFTGPNDRLTMTANAQPAILCHSIALLRVMQHEFGFDVSKSSFALGHSLGEYSALVATESISLVDAIKLVRLRGEAMQTSVSDKKTSMRALMINNGYLEDVEALMKKIEMVIPDGEIAEIANINSRSQVVISGSTKGVDYACSIIQAKGFAGRALPLPVSAPFHCSLMLPAANQLRPHLEATKFKEPCIEVISNFTGRPFENSSQIGPYLYEQISKTVKWQQSVAYARENDFVDEWIAIGPSKVLSNLIRREYPVDRVRSVSDVKDLEAFGVAVKDDKWDSYYL